MDIRRFLQVSRYAWKESKDLSEETGKSRLFFFFDMLQCYRKYLMWTNQYMKEKFYQKSHEEREIIGKKYYESGLIRDAWQKDFRENREFLIKYSDIKYEKVSLREKRNKAYTKRYHAGKNLFVEYGVNISRQHYLDGTISIGDNVLIAKHSFIDYSGNVEIKDNVQITNGVIIETHHHLFHSDYRKSRDAISTSLVIEEGAVIGSRAIILPSCRRIGKHARVGAGAVVTKDVPDFAVVVGVPARIQRIMDDKTKLTTDE